MEQHNNNLSTLPSELLENIFNYLSLYDLIKMESVNYFLHHYIRSNKWSQLVKLKNVTKINFVIENYRFINYDLSHSYITDDIAKHLGNCHSLNLSRCNQITGDLIKILSRTVKNLYY